MLRGAVSGSLMTGLQGGNCGDVLGAAGGLMVKKGVLTAGGGMGRCAAGSGWDVASQAGEPPGGVVPLAPPWICILRLLAFLCILPSHACSEDEISDDDRGHRLYGRHRMDEVGRGGAARERVCCSCLHGHAGQPCCAPKARQIACVEAHVCRTGLSGLQGGEDEEDEAPLDDVKRIQGGPQGSSRLYQHSPPHFAAGCWRRAAGVGIAHSARELLPAAWQDAPQSCFAFVCVQGLSNRNGTCDTGSQRMCLPVLQCGARSWSSG